MAIVDIIQSEETLECEAFVMATLPYPVFHLGIFAHCWLEKEKLVQSLLEKHFNKQEEHLKNSQDNIEELEKETPNIDKNIIFELFNAPINSSESMDLLPSFQQLEGHIKDFYHGNSHIKNSSKHSSFVNSQNPPPFYFESQQS
ncbi:hypothetical protein VP01_111g3 [Puccinia sorghi]|uniref:Uncharacterized protein n=1 Tax=Puccinia sorghi TaxID=27349 RepID=A0A0L6VSD9_9BASI|nr:hypothetical protein VP01_111g3 [Puccinia sorghi]